MITAIFAPPSYTHSHGKDEKLQLQSYPLLYTPSDTLAAILPTPVKPPKPHLDLKLGRALINVHDAGVQLGLLFRDESDTNDIVVSAIEQGSLADQDGT